MAGLRQAGTEDHLPRGHLCDVHLERTRFHLAAGEAGDARRYVDAARALVEECGYHRRDGEVEFLEERLSQRARE